MRDKYIFVPDAAVPPTHVGKRDEIAELFGINKDVRKQRANAASDKYVADLQAAVGHSAIHTALHSYEKEHLQGGGNWPRLKATLLLRYRNVLQIEEHLPDTADFFVTASARRERVGTVHFEERRFVSIGRPSLALNEVFVRRNDSHVPPRHYVALTTSATHVKRFVTRGLSAFDGMNMTLGLPLTSVLADPSAQATEIGGFMHNKLAGVLLNDNEHILTHTRGWGGNKRFISTGVSNRAAMSTRGVPFVSMYGVVTVDLALVPLADIFDVHRHDVASARLGVQAATILNTPHHTGGGDLAEQQYLGLRDTIRTRELLIKGGIPLAAIKRAPAGRVLLGIGSNTNRQHDAVPVAIAGLGAVMLATIVSQDHMTFRDPASALKWHFLEFNSALALMAARNALHALVVPGRRLVAFEKYAQLRPLGMV